MTKLKGSLPERSAETGRKISSGFSLKQRACRTQPKEKTSSISPLENCSGLCELSGSAARQREERRCNEPSSQTSCVHKSRDWRGSPALSRDRPFAGIQRECSLHRRTRPAYKTRAGEVLHCMEDIARHLAKQHAISRATLWRWYLDFVQRGYPGLKKSRRRDCGKSRYFDRMPGLASFVNAKAANKHLNAARIPGALARMQGSGSRGTLL